jgi:hypothetical protein
LVSFPIAYIKLIAQIRRTGMSYTYILPGFSGRIPPERLPVPEKDIGHYQPWIVMSYRAGVSKSTQSMEDQVLKGMPPNISPYSGQPCQNIYFSLTNDPFKGHLLVARFKRKESTVSHLSRIAPTGNARNMIHDSKRNRRLTLR